MKNKSNYLLKISKKDHSLSDECFSFLPQTLLQDRLDIASVHLSLY